MKKTAGKLFFGGLMSIAMTISSFAGTWQQNATGWWYDNGNGTYQNQGWFQDTDGKYYYFNTNGYMLSNTVTPDGFYVGADGSSYGRETLGEEAHREQLFAEKKRELERFAAADPDDAVDSYTIYTEDLNDDHIDELIAFPVWNTHASTPRVWIYENQSLRELTVPKCMVNGTDLSGHTIFYEDYGHSSGTRMFFYRLKRGSVLF